jgi:hypothetical protein
MNLLSKMMQGFNYNLTLIESDLYYKLYSFLSMGVLQYETLLAYQIHLNMEVAGINRLLEGYLPREFVPPSTVQSVLLRIKNELSRFGSGFQLAYTDVQHYYHIQDIAFCVKKRTIIHHA